MNTDSQELDLAAAEHLLDGALGLPGDPPPVPRPLAELLAAASAHGTDAELEGEDAAAAAFRTAVLAPGPRSRWKAWRGWFPFLRLLPLKIAAVSLVMVTAGGLALAAQLGGLPLGPLSPPPSVVVSPGSPHPSARPSAEPGRQTGPPSSSPSRAVLVDQCQTYTTTAPAKRANELGKPALRGLVNAAGGTSNVPSYCARLVPKQQPTGQATPGKPDGVSTPPVPRTPRSGQKPTKAKPSASSVPKPPKGGSDDGGTSDDGPDDDGGAQDSQDMPGTDGSDDRINP